MRDDGLHGDGAANDGVYAAYLSGSGEPGTVTFTVEATGSNRAGEPFTRRSELSTFIAAGSTPRQVVHLPLVVR